MEKRKNVTLRIDEKLASLIKIQAIYEHCSVSDIVNRLIEQYLKDKKAL